MGKNTLVGVDGNAYAIMGYVTRAMRHEHKSKTEIDTYLRDATSSDYTHLLAVSFDMCEELNKNKI